METELPPETMEHPSTQRLKRVASALGPLVDDVVFIGGAIAPLLQSDPPFEAARPTNDVDGVVASATYADMQKLEATLRELRFRQDPDDMPHLHRWTSPDGDLFDLMPTGTHLGGSGHVWDRNAIASSVLADLGGGVSIRHASAPAFLCLKWVAHDDRGADDPFNSHDLEDIVALMASRPTIIAEVRVASTEARAFIIARVGALLTDDRKQDLLAAHLNNAQDRRGALELVLSRFEELRRLAGSA